MITLIIIYRPHVVESTVILRLEILKKKQFSCINCFFLAINNNTSSNNQINFCAFFIFVFSFSFAAAVAVVDLTLAFKMILYMYYVWHAIFSAKK